MSELTVITQDGESYVADAETFHREAKTARRHQDSLVVSWQSELKPGDNFVQVLHLQHEDLTIYGLIVDPLGDIEPDEEEEEENSVETSAEELLADAAELEAEKRWQEETWSSPGMKNVRFAKCYSKACPEGEYGNVHVASIAMQLSEEEFMTALHAGWPTFTVDNK